MGHRLRSKLPDLIMTAMGIGFGVSILYWNSQQNFHGDGYYVNIFLIAGFVIICLSIVFGISMYRR